MAEIKEILDKHDIAGSIVIHTPGFGEHLVKIDPSYSCAFIDNTPGKEAIRVRTRLQEDYNGDSKKRNDAQRDTVNMFHILGTLAGQQSLHLLDTDDMLKKHFNPHHFGKGGSSTTQQNN